MIVILKAYAVQGKTLAVILMRSVWDIGHKVAINDHNDGPFGNQYHIVPLTAATKCLHLHTYK